MTLAFLVVISLFLDRWVVARLYHHIQKLESLLAYAVAHNDAVEAARLRAELTRIVEGL